MQRRLAILALAGCLTEGQAYRTTRLDGYTWSTVTVISNASEFHAKVASASANKVDNVVEEQHQHLQVKHTLLTPYLQGHTIVYELPALIFTGLLIVVLAVFFICYCCCASEVEDDSDDDDTCEQVDKTEDKDCMALVTAMTGVAHLNARGLISGSFRGPKLEERYVGILLGSESRKWTQCSLAWWASEYAYRNNESALDLIYLKNLSSARMKREIDHSSSMTQVMVWHWRVDKITQQPFFFQSKEQATTFRDSLSRLVGKVQEINRRPRMNSLTGGASSFGISRFRMVAKSIRAIGRMRQTPTRGASDRPDEDRSTQIGTASAHF